MIIMSADDMASVYPDIEELEWGFSFGGDSEPTREEITRRLTKGIRVCGRLGWDDLASQVRRFVVRSDNGERGPKMEALAQDIKEAFADKISRLRVGVIQDIALFDNASVVLCSGPLKPDLAVSEEELNLGGRALSCGLSTAAVSHAMRSIESALHATANYMGVSFPGSLVELQDWLVLTEKIKSEIDKLQSLQRGQAKTERQKNLSELMIKADGFRLAWRNHVQHAREKYEEPEARKIMEHVGDYLRVLSATL
jgi:hypothetical protein